MIHSSLQRQGLWYAHENCVFWTQDIPLSFKFILIAYNSCNETELDSKLRAMGGVFVLEIKHLKQDLWKERAVGQ